MIKSNNAFSVIDERLYIASFVTEVCSFLVSFILTLLGKISSQIKHRSQIHS